MVTDWFPLSTQTAKVLLQYNLSTVYALRGEYEKAGELVRQVYLTFVKLLEVVLIFKSHPQLWNASKTHGIDVPIQVVTLALYVELQSGESLY